MPQCGYNRAKLTVGGLTMIHQKPGEEVANAITHGVGVALSLAGLVILVVMASLFGDVWRVVSFSIYGTTLLLLFLASTLYHSFRSPKVKRVFRILDHSSIYLLIAGTYTPITLVALRGPLGWTFFGLIWGLAIAGIVFKMFLLGKLRIVSALFYIGMGWMVVVAWKPVLNMAPVGLMIWLLAGGVLYTVGTIFYAMRCMPYQHAVWHLFVLGGSIAHFLGILLFLSHA